MLKWVTHYDEVLPTFHARYDLVIDAHGILRKAEWSGRSWRNLRADMESMARGRFAANSYAGWWWWKRVPVGDSCLTMWKCGHARHYNLGGWYHSYRLVADKRVTKNQLRRLEGLPPELRREVVITVTCAPP
jgi:hypothetical protein